MAVPGRGDRQLHAGVPERCVVAARQRTAALDIGVEAPELPAENLGVQLVEPRVVAVLFREVAPLGAVHPQPPQVGSERLVRRDHDAAVAVPAEDLGIQYTPVASIATELMRQACSQSTNRCGSGVTVLNRRTGSASRSTGTAT